MLLLDMLCSPLYKHLADTCSSVTTGTMEERSIVEPIRNVMYQKGAYYEAECQSIDPETRTLVACFPKDAGFPQSCFRMQYDHLVVSVGSINNTFGVKGVEDHCFYFKSIKDANKLRSQMSECFERAALPYTSEEVRPVLPCHHLCTTCALCTGSCAQSPSSKAQRKLQSRPVITKGRCACKRLT